MIYETIDLYKYFNRKEKSKGGKLTVYCPDNSVEINKTRKHPAMLVLPGGGYIGVSFREGEPIALEFLRRGFACFVLNYETEPFSYAFSPLIEGAMAMKYIRENANKYNIKEDGVCAVGFSAGGHLTSYLGTAFNGQLYNDFFGGNTSGIRPDAIILSYAVITKDIMTGSKTILRICNYKEELLESVSTELLVKGDSSPSYIWMTADDGMVNCKHALKFATACAENGVKFSLHIYPHGQHGLSLGDTRVYKEGENFSHSEGVVSWMDEATEFLKENGIKIDDDCN